MGRAKMNLKQDTSALERCQSIAQVIVSNQIETVKIPESLGIRRAKRKPRGRDVCKIPFDLVIEILIRLPAKSLMRFKCVSKQWSSFISGPYFRNLMLTRQHQPRLHMCFVDETGQSVLLSAASSTSPDNNTSFVVDQNLTGIGGLFLNGLHSLMCFSVKKKACIYNSTTSQLLTLPAIESDIIAEKGQTKDTRYYIGHDPVNDQYKIFCTIVICSEHFTNLKSEHWVFLLEAGRGSWKKVVPLEYYHSHFPAILGRSINGSVVHYMAWLDMYTFAVVSFDIRSEELTTIPVPREAGNVSLPGNEMKADLIECGGKIVVFNHTYLKDEGTVDLWVLKDVGKKIWSKKTLVLLPCQRHLVHDTELVVKGTTQDGKVILVPWKMRSQLYVLFYDMRLNDLRKVLIKGVPRPWFDKDCYSDLKFMDESESNFCFKSLNSF